MADKIYDAFDSIKASEKIKSSTRQMIKKEAGKGRRQVHFTVKMIAACASLLVMLGLGGVYGVSVYPVSYVSIDVNPSIELSLNCWDRVISATAYNEEGVGVLDAVSVKGMQFENALETIVGSEAMAQYLNSGADMTIAIATDSQVREMQLSESIDNCGSHYGYRISGYTADMETVSEAHHNAMSIGKYDAYVKLHGYDDTVTVEGCRDMSVSEIHDLIHEHESDGTHHSTGGSDNENDNSGHNSGWHNNRGNDSDENVSSEHDNNGNASSGNENNGNDNSENENNGNDNNENASSGNDNSGHNNRHDSSGHGHHGE